MNVNNCFCLPKALGKTLILTTQLVVFLRQRIFSLGFPAATFRREARQRTFVSLVTPGGQMRRIEPLATQ